jgi:hypothetical protein
VKAPKPTTAQEKSPDYQGFLDAPQRIRTSDLRFRRPTLYPAELGAQEQRFGHFHVGSRPKPLSHLSFIRFALVAMPASARSAGLQTSASTSGAQGRSSRWGPSAKSLCHGDFRLPASRSEAAGPILIASLVPFLSARPRGSVRGCSRAPVDPFGSARSDSRLFAAQPARPPAFHQHAGPDGWGPARVGVVVATEQTRTNANSPELAPRPRHGTRIRGAPRTRSRAVRRVLAIARRTERAA